MSVGNGGSADLEGDAAAARRPERALEGSPKLGSRASEPPSIASDVPVASATACSERRVVARTGGAAGANASA
jgi:hypothetical protein